MNTENEYRARIELTRALLAVQILRRRRDLSDEHAAYAEVIERSLRSLRALTASADLRQEPERDRRS